MSDDDKDPRGLKARSPVHGAILAYVESARVAFELAEALNVSGDGQAGQSDTGPHQRAANHADLIMLERLQDVAARRSVSLDDVLSKLRLWMELTGADQALPFDLGPCDRLVASAFDDLDHLVDLQKASA